MADRIYENTFKLITIAFAEFKDITRDDECYTDEAVLGEISDMVEKFAEFKQIMHGFEGEWDQSKKIEEKLTFKEMWHNYKNFKHAHNHDLKHECPMKKLWKDYFGDITPEDVMHTVYGMMPHMPHLNFMPHQMMNGMFHHQAPAQSNWHFPQMPHLETPHMEMPHMANPFASWGQTPVHHQQAKPAFNPFAAFMPAHQQKQAKPFNPFEAMFGHQQKHQQSAFNFGQGFQMPHLF